MYTRVHTYDQMMTNIAECVNAILKDTRALPIATFLDHIRAMHRAWFVEHREISSSKEIVLSNHSESQLKLADVKSIRYVVRPVDHYELEIVNNHLNPRVNLYERTCMFEEFNYYEIPCSHASTACKVRNIDL